MSCFLDNERAVFLPHFLLKMEQILPKKILNFKQKQQKIASILSFLITENILQALYRNCGHNRKKLDHIYI